MSKLTQQQRDALPASDFALPQSREYPIPDASHAEDALRDLHNATPKQQEQIRRAIRDRYPDIPQTSKVRVSGRVLEGKQKQK